MIIQPFYDEALLTGISQIARGGLEALVPSGWMVNALLDAIFTIPNLLSTISCNHCTGLLHSDPKYFPLLQVLNVG